MILGGVAKVMDIMRKYVSNDIVFTDAWNPNGHNQEIAENELLPGELLAVVFQVGCYTVRSAMRVYKLDYDAGCDMETDIPASKEEVELVRKDGYAKNFFEPFGYTECTDAEWVYASGIIRNPSWEDSLHIYNEISAKHNANPDNIFLTVCRIRQSKTPNWCKYIGDIYTVKENQEIPDEYASLLVYTHYEGSSFGVDTWYRLEPTGKVTELVLHPFDSKRNERRFE